jgi:hypothetical protein
MDYDWMNEAPNNNNNNSNNNSKYNISNSSSENISNNDMNNSDLNSFNKDIKDIKNEYHPVEAWRPRTAHELLLKSTYLSCDTTVEDLKVRDIYDCCCYYYLSLLLLVLLLNIIMGAFGKSKIKSFITRKASSGIGVLISEI